MEKIILIDDDARIFIEPLNYTLQYRRQSRKQISWRVAGYFPDLTSLATEYLNEAPRRADNAIKSIDEMVVIIKKAEARICKLIIDQKNYATHELGGRIG